MEDSKNVKLSKTILDMKFMKRSKERVEKEADDAEGSAMYSKEITDQMKKSGNIVFADASITSCLDLIEGRLSFGGMNPEIEKLMQIDYAKKIEEAERKKETDVTDVEMAQEYGAISNKFRKNKNRKFRKPADN